MYINLETQKLVNIFKFLSKVKSKNNFCSHVYVLKENNLITFTACNKIILLQSSIKCDEYNSCFDCYLSFNDVKSINVEEQTTTLYINSDTYIQDTLLKNTNSTFHSYLIKQFNRDTNENVLLSITKPLLLSLIGNKYSRYYNLTDKIKVRNDWLKKIIKGIDKEIINFYISYSGNLIIEDDNCKYLLQYKKIDI